PAITQYILHSSPRLPPPPSSTLFPYTTLFRSGQFDIPATYKGSSLQVKAYTKWMLNFDTAFLYSKNIPVLQKTSPVTKTKKISRDRKSTRLNSSHVKISYAVFCLKKKKHQQNA